MKHKHYYKDVSNYEIIDVYRILDLFGLDNAVGHAFKKLLCSGHRGAKDQRQDIEEAIDTLQRKLEMLSEDALSQPIMEAFYETKV